MRVISHKRLKDFWEAPKSPAGSEHHLAAWYKVVLAETWHNFAELRGRFQSADKVGDCVVFDVWNNNLRIIGRVRYATDVLPGVVYILAVLTHAQYDENKWPDDCGCHEKPPNPKKKTLRPVKQTRRKRK
jgi:mRNA interferase HigB